MTCASVVSCHFHSRPPRWKVPPVGKEAPLCEHPTGYPPPPPPPNSSNSEILYKPFPRLFCLEITSLVLSVLLGPQSNGGGVLPPNGRVSCASGFLSIQAVATGRTPPFWHTRVTRHTAALPSLSLWCPSDHPLTSFSSSETPAVGGGDRMERAPCGSRSHLPRGLPCAPG